MMDDPYRFSFTYALLWVARVHGTHSLDYSPGITAWGFTIQHALRRATSKADRRHRTRREVYIDPKDPHRERP